MTRGAGMYVSDDGPRVVSPAFWREMLTVISGGYENLEVVGRMGEGTRLIAVRGGSMLPNQGQVYSVTDNGGEFVVRRVNLPEHYTIIPHSRGDQRLSSGTLAYRVRCTILGERIDYAADHDDLYELCAPFAKAWERPERTAEHGNGRCGTCKYARPVLPMAPALGLPMLCSALGGDDGLHAGEEYAPVNPSVAGIEFSEWGRLAVSPLFGCVLWEPK